MNQFDIWLRQQIVLAYLHSLSGSPKPASVVIGEVAELVDYIKTGDRMKEPEPEMKAS